jgi:3-hydroxy-9,10-secoandrosta-1,3,5(10)-triene-9,17-dione monooxygenase reductase component
MNARSNAQLKDRRDMAEIDADLFRGALGCFASGVTIVTTLKDGASAGTTVSAFSALSMDPPLVLVSMDRGSNTLAAIRDAGFFGVNILSAEQAGIARKFASSKGGPKFEGVDWQSEVTGAPLFAENSSTIDCALEMVHDGGDHEILVGRVLFVDCPGETEPLLYFKSAFRELVSS